MTDRREAVAAVVREYDAQGWHRTATTVDADSAAWLASRVRALGAAPALEPFPLSRVDLGPGFVEVDGRREAGTPIFDGTFTDDAGIAGRIGLLGSDAEIGFAVASPVPEQQGPLREARRAAGHRAIVAVTRGGTPGLALFNAPDFTAPFGPPVLQVPSTAEAWLREQAERGATARVVAPAARRDAEAVNVTATLPGQDAALAPVVVMTPRSGWWECASERGGGIACWLEALRAVCAADRRRTVHFVASSGHELGHIGLEAYIARQPALVRQALVWVHLGANIGAHGGAVRPLAGDDELRDQVAAAFGHVPSIAVVSERVHARGESKEVAERGGRFVSLVGSNARFHLPTDRWPDAIDLDALSRHAAATARLVTALTEATTEAAAGV